MPNNLFDIKDQLPMWEERSTSTWSWAATNQGFNGPIAVIMTPTRELALQIGRECRKFSWSNVRMSVVYGGTSISEQIAELEVISSKSFDSFNDLHFYLFCNFLL